MSITAKITDDMKQAMRAKDKLRLGVIRLMLAAFKQKEVDERIEIDDVMALAILEKMVKQRRESIKQYQAGGRPELADQEAVEIEIIQNYLPAQLSETEVAALIEHAFTVTGASTVKDMGKVMSELKPKIQGRADMGLVSQMIKAKFS